MSTANAMRLLIADDDPDSLAAYALFFDAYGYDVRTVGDGVDALTEYRMWHPDAVFIDIEMPRFDGWVAARQIRSIRASPVPALLAVTALSSPSERAESFRAGFDYHFVKPAQLPVILTAIASTFLRCCRWIRELFSAYSSSWQLRKLKADSVANRQGRRSRISRARSDTRRHPRADDLALVLGRIAPQIRRRGGRKTFK